MYILNTKTIHHKAPIVPINFTNINQWYEFVNIKNEDFHYAYDIKYLISILDDFSRKDLIYGLQSKSPVIILKNIKEYCLYNVLPDEFLSD